MTVLPPSRAAPILERSPLPLVELHGPEHLVSHVNAAFCALMSVPCAELLGRPFCDVVPGASPCRPLLDRVYQTGESITHAIEDPGPAQTSWVYAMWPSLDADERAVGVIVGLTNVASARQNVRDMNEALLIAALREHESKETAEQLNAHLESEISERRSAEHDLRDANTRLAATDRHKDEFLAMLAHELRNPLVPITSAAQIIKLVGSSDPRIMRAQAMIERQAMHLARLVDELLDLSRIQEGKIRLARVHVDLLTAVTRALESCEPLIQTQRHALSLDLAGGPGLHVDADPARLDQILVNLITNAAKYTRSGGTIAISLAREGESAVVRVRDNGIGIAPANLRRVFELFTQVEQSLERSQGGLGLGLKLVKELVDLHGGTIEARSEGLGTGSEFILRLPTVATIAPAVVADADPPAARTGKHILVVDDLPDNRASMAQLLEMHGHTVELAEDGEHAVEQALRHHPEIAFVDIGLPKLSGYEVARQIRAQPGGAEIVLVALSGYGQPEDQRRALEAGFDRHLTKPVGAGTLLEVLDELAPRAM